MSKSEYNARRGAWLSQAEVADYLGVTDRTVRSYIARGILPASRIESSRTIRIRAEDAEAILRPIPTVGGDAA